MGVVHEPVEDAVRERGIADLFVPLRDRQLRSQDRRTYLVAILADLPEVSALSLTQRCHSPIVYHQHIDAAEPSQQTAQAAVGARHGKIAK